MPMSPGSKNNKSQPRHRPTIPDNPGIRSWEDLEGVKSRVATAMDRVEFLASSRNMLTEMSAAQAEELGQTFRTRSQPNLHMTEHLGKHVGRASGLLKKRSDLLRTSNTVFKRMDALNKYVVNQETKKAGPEAAEKAKTSARGTQPKVRPYPEYEDLIRRSGHEEGQTRDLPMMAVKCSISYTPPPGALRHGVSTRSMSSTH